MYFIPMWLFLKWQTALVANSGLDLTNLTWFNFFFSNLLPVTLGNIIGWALFAGIFYAVAYNTKK